MKRPATVDERRGPNAGATAPRWGETEAAGPAAGIHVSRDPPIFWGPSAVRYPLGPASSLAERIGDRRAYFLISSGRNRPGALSAAPS